MTWHVRDSRYLFTSPWYNLRQDDITLPNGDDITYTLIDHPGYVMVVPLLDDGRVVMERVYRHTVLDTLLECPAGGRDGDTPEQAAHRELEEETGYRAKCLTRLGHFYGSTGISNEAFDLFLATGLTHDGVIQRENTEQLDVHCLPFEQVRQLALDGKIQDGPSTLAILLADNFLRSSETSY